MKLVEARVEIPEQTARWLWQHASGMAAHEVFLARDKEADAQVAAEYLALVARRARREPLQYVIAEAEFAGLTLYVDHRVLVPRPETEGLVALAAAQIGALRGADPERTLTVFDLGVGSGAITIALIMRMRSKEGIRWMAGDLSEDALAVARRNARRYGVEDRVDWRWGDGLDVVATGEVIDVLVANPPYIPLADAPLLQPEVREHEPGLALFAGQDGLEAYRMIAAKAKRVLANDATVLLEVGDGQAKAVQALFLEALPDATAEAYADFQGILRNVVIHRQV